LILRQVNSNALDTKDGISLLSLKHHLLLSYLQSLTILTARRALGHSLVERSPPTEPFSSTERGPRGANAGDLVDSMVEARVVFEKVKVLENKMRYQLEKLVKLSQSEQSSSSTVVDGKRTTQHDLPIFLTLWKRSTRFSP
jgi:U3 small nucleolar ribonucleoprotein protein LCP5